MGAGDPGPHETLGPARTPDPDAHPPARPGPALSPRRLFRQDVFA